LKEIGQAPIFMSGASIVETPISLTATGQAHASILGRSLVNRTTYLVNFSGIHELVSSPIGRQPIWANAMEIYIDAAAGTVAFGLKC
jgi:broad specificity phosphatase PhoE